MTEDLSKEEAQSFTSWKLDVIDAMACDPDLEDIDFRVAFRLMQHINARSRDAHPSLERLAAQLGVHRDTVRRSLTRMCDENGGRHWLTRERNSRTEPYFYSFVTGRMNNVLDGKIDREDRAREATQERKRRRLEVARMQPREVARKQSPEVAAVQSVEVARLQPKHLTENYLRGTPISSLNEGEVNSYARAKDGF